MRDGPAYLPVGEVHPAQRPLRRVPTAGDLGPLPEKLGSVRPFLQRDGNRTGGRSFGVLDPAHG